MSLMRKTLEGGWQLTYDNEARQVLVMGSSGERFSVNEFLALNAGTPAEIKFEGLIIDLFPNTAEDDDRASACGS